MYQSHSSSSDSLKYLFVVYFLFCFSCSKLLDSLEEDYKARSTYLVYLVNAHQGLLATHSHLERLVERVERYDQLIELKIHLFSYLVFV